MEDAPQKKVAPGAPAWILTFADLMSLLLAFFVLLFSFSELDKQKFKELSGSLKDAFGVQREVKAKETPLGTSFIQREFSPGRTNPTIRNQVRQESMNELKRYALAIDVEKVEDHLSKEMESGLVEVANDGEQVITIRIREMNSFPIGSAELSKSFYPVIKKISDVLHEIGGHVVVAGHTDPVPIHNSKFRSNWDLASARAATVLHQITAVGELPNQRFRLAGYADTRPLGDNNTEEGRAQNRRVEVVLLRDDTIDADGNFIVRGKDIETTTDEAAAPPSDTPETSD
ncbi:OmpA family protein [Spongiibacter sp. KMU-158]|uniref:OmpA family protein n=1 Tax=Spongiibacter pelagi TaxID=2760804 RepID=A0A927GV60_9GAMM|nr:flagellar motor protein MotB [Spongiibacter pelagi]MBD2858050.1 OmpA family protein [Spongiibacter pelagi]